MSDISTQEVETPASKPASRADSKAVRFADSLDIASEGAGSGSSSTAAKTEPKIEPLGDVVERSSRPEELVARPATKKPSRFRKERGDTSKVVSDPIVKGPHQAPARFLDEDRTTAPTGPDGQTIATSIVERQATTEVKEPDEFDAALLQQEVAVEYHRARNRLIQKEGGFLKQNQDAIKPLDEEEGGPRRMSKFKAARLSRQ